MFENFVVKKNMPSTIPDQSVSYLRDKNVPDLVEYMLQELAAQPEADRVLRELLSKPVTQILLRVPAGLGHSVEIVEMLVLCTST